MPVRFTAMFLNFLRCFTLGWKKTLGFGLIASSCVAANLAAYEPLALQPSEGEIHVLDLQVTDELRQRTLPIRVFLPRATVAAPVILFSHGLGGSIEANVFQNLHWAKRGYGVVVLQHPGSDASLLKGKRLGQRVEALRSAATLENWNFRVQDVHVTLEYLKRASASHDHPLKGRLNLSLVGMSGHSFGAATTQALSGQVTKTRRGVHDFTHPQIKAALMMSPQAGRGASFSQVKLPWLLMTGSEDHGLIGDVSAVDRRKVFAALPPGDKYELVLDRAQHFAFSDRHLHGNQPPRHPEHHRIILAISTAFWDAHLKGDPAAGAWLKGDGPKSLLGAGDLWLKK